MELMEKQGFKQTEIGFIPSDWFAKTVEEVSTEMVQGVNTAIDIPEYVESGVPMLKANNVIDGVIDLDDCDYVSEKTFKRYTERYKIRKNDFLFSNIGARLGKGALYNFENDATYAWNVMRIRPKTNFVLPIFLTHSINSNIFFKQVLSSLTGSGMGFVPKNILKNLLVPLPPTLSEQKAIATALSDVDDLITNLDKLITKKKAIKQGAMQQLLTPPHKGGKRLAGFTGEWVEKKLGDFSECIRGVSYNGSQDLFPHDTENSIRLLRSNNILNKNIIFGDLQYVKKERVRNHQIMQEKDILICMANGSKALVGKAGQFKRENYAYTFGAFMGVLRPNLNICNPDYLFHLFSSFDFRCHLDFLLSGSSINNLRPSDIESFTFFSPQLTEQNAIAQILSDMDKEIEQLESKKAKYQSLKQGMMQELLTGKTRLV